jgi:hypothetical protein
MEESPRYGGYNDERKTKAEKQSSKVAELCLLMFCRQRRREGRGALVWRIVGDGFYASGTDDRDIGEEPVAAASDSLDEARVLR